MVLSLRPMLVRTAHDSDYKTIVDGHMKMVAEEFDNPLPYQDTPGDINKT
jgi:hypothetical protein